MISFTRWIVYDGIVDRFVGISDTLRATQKVVEKARIFTEERYALNCAVLRRNPNNKSVYLIPVTVIAPLMEE